MTSRALRLRRQRPEWFDAGSDYLPLEADSEHALGFVRSGAVACVVTRAAHRLVESGGWSGATVSLPQGRWSDLLTGLEHTGVQLPVSLLIRLGD